MAVFGIILFLMAVANFFTIRKMQTIQKEINEVSTNWLPRAIAISEISRNISDLRINQLQHAITPHEEKRQNRTVAIIDLIDKINENLSTYEMLKKASEAQQLYSETEQKLYEAFDGTWEDYQDISFTFFALARENRNTEAINLLNEDALLIYDECSNHLAALVRINEENSKAAAQRAEKTNHATKKFSTTLLLASIIISLLLSGVLVRYITNPILDLEKAARKVAGGDLDIRLNLTGKDEIGNMAQSFDKMTASLKEARANAEQQANKLRAQNKELANAMRELRETQDQLLMKEKMASLGNLVAGVAHEINNPIGSINATTDITIRCIKKIEDEIKKSESIEALSSNENFKKYFRILKENTEVSLAGGERIATIVKSLKNFSRLDQSEYQKANIHEGLDSSVTLLDNEFQNRITVCKKYGDIPDIICYPGQLNQVFLNILQNASSAIKDSGTVEIKTSKENGHIHIDIVDDGKGIAQNEIKELFSFKFSSKGSRIKMSSGLSSAYNIIQKHEGEIKINSELGKGTTVSIILPIK